MWPELSYDEWKETKDTLHMWMQIVGKVKLALAPFINQWWEVAFYVTVSGMTTGPIPFGSEAFQIDFNFILHTLTIQTSSGKQVLIPLLPCSVADFYKTFMAGLSSLGIDVKITLIPVEVANTIHFTKDTQHESYDKDAVEKWWQILLQTSIVFDRFRSSFRGKSSPTQFFWGSFDLNGTRFSGRTAVPPKMKGSMDKIMRFAENEENFAFGFWPGDKKFPHPAFYSYLYPAPKELTAMKFVKGASFNEQLGECILPYEVVRKSAHPEKKIMQFLETTYTQSATLSGWNMAALHAKVPHIKMKELS